MSFQKTNQELLEKMRKGELGEDFRKAIHEHPEAVVNHSNELYRCPECGELFGRMSIELRISGGVLVSAAQGCDKCGSHLELVSGGREHREGDLSCPRCKEAFDVFQPQVRILVD